MKTLTVTSARQNLGHWLKRAARGEEIGVVVGADVIAFRLVPVTAADYAHSEYGLTVEEADSAEKRIARSVARERRAGIIKEFNGDWRQLRS
jgi:antitoxin (DNA-binding transcriptional repressor) of toxin-antitoxin stability system